VDEPAAVKLVLWDVDGTLVDSAGLGRDAFCEAFEAVTGSQPSVRVPFAGRTDLEIAFDMLHSAGIDGARGLLDSFGDELEAAMAKRAQALREYGRAMPGAAAALARLQSRPDVLQSLLTGNIAPNAKVKLSAFGLDRHLDFEIGAYGSDHRMRGELVAIARSKAEQKHGVELASADVVLVGDTPLDIRAAHEGGARAVGIATGPYDAATLRDAGADAVLEDLTDTDALVGAVLASPG
jgi:phosphoglycolate phosphatase-like HAD superfamily hydrolase